QVEVLGERGEVAPQLDVVGVVGRTLRHRELGELGGRLARDEVSRLVHGAAGVVDVPQAADLASGLVTVECDAESAQVARTCQAGGAGADDGVACPGSVTLRRHSPPCSSFPRQLSRHSMSVRPQALDSPTRTTEGSFAPRV